MYLEHFGLREPPFRITPHPDFFFDGAERGATLDALAYAILHEEGMIRVTGEIGSGKTMLCRMLLERLPAQVETVFLANPSYSREDILHAIAEELKLPAGPQRGSAVLRELQNHLLGVHAAGRRVVVLIDEAHAMPRDTLEEVRLLSNLETSRHKLLQIVLFAQPELDAMLAKPELRQLKDRITHSFRMRALTQAEVGAYLEFRMRAAGHGGPNPFSTAAVGTLANVSGGLIRRINVLADKSLLAAYTQNARAVEPRHVRAAQADADLPLAPKAAATGKSRIGTAIAIGVAGVAIGASVQWWISRATAPAAPPAAAHAAIPVAPQTRTSVVEAPKPQPSFLSSAQEQRLAGYAAGTGTLLAARIAAARERLRSEPDASYGIELFVSENTDPARLERFLLRARDLAALDHLYVVPIASSSRYRVRVLYGTYPDRDAAEAALRRLPQRYQAAFRATLRSFQDVRRSV